MAKDIVKRLIVASYSEANELEDLLLEASEDIDTLIDIIESCLHPNYLPDKFRNV